jgi:hypothetical protein
VSFIDVKEVEVIQKTHFYLKLHSLAQNSINATMSNTHRHIGNENNNSNNINNILIILFIINRK